MAENVSNETLQILLDRIDALQKQGPQGTTGAVSTWGKTSAQPSEPESVSVPISVQTQAGKVRLYLNFQGIPFTPEAINALLDSLLNKGIPVDAWQDKGAWGGNKWKR